MTKPLLLATLLASFGVPAAAQTVLTGDYIIEGDLTVQIPSSGAGAPSQGSLYVEEHSIIDGSLCLGNSCFPTMTFANDETLVFRYTQQSIVFDDTSSATSPDRDWKLRINDPQSRADGGIDKFSVEDTTAGTTPFTIEGGAPENALWIDDTTGDIGLGTSFPGTELHIVDGTTPTIRLEQDTSNGAPARIWNIMADDSGLYFNDDGTNFLASPFQILDGNTGNELLVLTNGTVGIGTNDTAAKLHIDLDLDDEKGFFLGDGLAATSVPAAMAHIQSSRGFAKLLIEETFGTANPRTLLNLTNNGRPEIVMANTATNGEWSFGAGTDFFLKVGTVGSTSGAKTKVFTVKGNGDAIVAGTLTTGGTTCGGGCDRVFTEQAIIPGPDYAASMWAQGHLPHVGPTREGAPINVSEKLGGMLNALEHAHVFIDELRHENAQLKMDKAAQDSQFAAQEARIARLEAQLAALVAPHATMNQSEMTSP